MKQQKQPIVLDAEVSKWLFLSLLFHFRFPPSLCLLNFPYLPMFYLQFPYLVQRNVGTYQLSDTTYSLSRNVRTQRTNLVLYLGPKGVRNYVVL